MEIEPIDISGEWYGKKSTYGNVYMPLAFAHDLRCHGKIRMFKKCGLTYIWCCECNRRESVHTADYYDAVQMFGVAKEDKNELDK